MTKVMSANALLAEIRVGDSDGWDVISLREPDPEWARLSLYQEIDGAARFGRLGDLLVLTFEDIDHDMPGRFPPARDDVRRALEWARGRDKIIVHCSAGISRSAAIAYVIEAWRTGLPAQAIKVLSPLKHHPNRLIVSLGAEELGLDLLTPVKKFERERRRLFMGAHSRSRS